MRYLTIILGTITTFLFLAFMPTALHLSNTETLSDSEKAGLIKMREEEKLTFEVYTFLDEKWNHQVFNNIKQSEIKHGELIKGLLTQFNIKDPYLTTNGKYANIELQNLYMELTKRGSLSLKDAFTVGAIIEDMDIADLDKLMAATENKDILEVYENLNRGSRNHIRAFTRQLNMLNVPYTPLYLSQEIYTAIINGDHEDGNSALGNSGCKSKGEKGCNGKNGKSCAGKDSKKSCGNNPNSCKGSKGNKKGCCK